MKPRRSSLRLGLGVSVSLAALYGIATGCSAAGGLASFSGAGGASAGADSGGTLSGGTESGGTQSGSGGSPSSGTRFTTGPSTGATIDPDAACATSTATATLAPVNIYVMVDRSASMSGTKWNSMTAALTAFFQDPGAAGLRVALRFFPGSGCDDPGCSVSTCALPAVPLGELTADAAPTDTQEQALVDSINSHSANGGDTPLAVALQGAESWASTYHATNPGEKVVVVIVTDGVPNACGGNVAVSNAPLNNAAAGIPTYAIALEGSSLNLMNQIAQNGGTNTAFNITSGSNTETDFLNAMLAIQGNTVSCTFTLPTTGGNGEPVDPHKVNVDYTDPSGQETTLGQASSSGNCGQGGWFYDNAAQPTTITLCPSTCQQVQGESGSKIDLYFGCATKPNG